MTQGTEQAGGQLASNAGELEALRRAQKGDEPAFEELVSRYGRELYGLALFLTGQASDAEDVVQETFLGAYQGLAAFEGRSSIRTWLTRILVHKAARRRRSERVRSAAQAEAKLSAAAEALLRGTAPATPATASEIRMDVLQVMQALQPEHREVVVLRELEGLSYREIAQVLDIPEGTVESRLFRAREALKAHLKDYMA